MKKQRIFVIVCTIVLLCSFVIAGHLTEKSTGGEISSPDVPVSTEVSASNKENTSQEEANISGTKGTTEDIAKTTEVAEITKETETKTTKATEKSTEAADKSKETETKTTKATEKSTEVVDKSTEAVTKTTEATKDTTKETTEAATQKADTTKKTRNPLWNRLHPV